MVDLRTTTTPQAHLDLVRSIALAANTALNAEDVLHVAIDGVSEHLGWPIGIVWLPRGSRWEPALWHADDDRLLDRLRVRTAAVSPGEGVLGALLATGAPASVWRLEQSSAETAAAIEAGLRTAMAFTVRVGDEPVAALQGFTRDERRPDTAVLATMETICGQVARVIERERSHHELHRSQTEFAAAQTLSRVGSWSWDVGDDRVRWSAQMYDNFDIDETEFDGTYERFLSLVHPADREAVAQAVSEALETGAPFTLEHRTTTVPVRWIRCRATVDHDEDGQVRRLWGTAQDVTDIAARLTAPRRAGVVDGLDGEDREQALRQLLLREDISSAIEREELELRYQPVVELDGGSLSGVEALLRWRRSDDELVGSLECVPLLEELGLIGRAGRWVLDRACRDLAAWRERFGTRLTVAVNVSPSQLLDPGFAEDVADILDRHRLPPRALVLEITESVLSGDLGAVAQQVTALRRLGTQLVLDDFGTGYSSLARLRELPLDGLKIDRSFLAPVASTHDPPPILRALFALADHLDLTVIAEGVEHPAQLAVLLEHGCDEAQGFLFAPPVAAERLTDLLADPSADLPSV
ncbi:MAG: EAL domain-containing protein [Nitriliruptorales bacterium]|nr:EAL domain-containing protein [Nitriliruptorales bacterium]